ncbi:MAG TPA: AbrB/MazE/SpoVT family DNA-binding domain-containing protein [Steroidobacteraceae bacterium]|nr:AbrB/MazE/SpoVT family DNA-binding domain-containing protein [Steroidobacteraceae bacterium]
MATARSKLTAQGQISVPAEVRKKLGLGPGSVLEWDERDDEVIVRRAGKYSSADIHAAIFPSGISGSKAGRELKEGIRQLMRKRHARD